MRGHADLPVPSSSGQGPRQGWLGAHHSHPARDAAKAPGTGRRLAGQLPLQKLGRCRHVYRIGLISSPPILVFLHCILECQMTPEFMRFAEKPGRTAPASLAGVPCPAFSAVSRQGHALFFLLLVGFRSRRKLAHPLDVPPLSLDVPGDSGAAGRHPSCRAAAWGTVASLIFLRLGMPWEVLAQRARGSLGCSCVVWEAPCLCASFPFF